MKRLDVLGGSFVGRNAGDAVRLEDGGEVFIRWVEIETEKSLVSAADEERETDQDEEAAVEEGSADAPRRLYIRASTGTEDRAGDVIEASGWDLTAYERNPVFLWAHERWRPPIGRSLRTWVDGDSLMALIEFAPTVFAGEVADLFERGFMHGVSVGFRPLEVETRRSLSGRTGLRFVRQELLEISAAPVPMHADTLSVASGHALDQRGSDGLREAVEALWKSVIEIWS